MNREAYGIIVSMAQVMISDLAIEHGTRTIAGRAIKHAVQALGENDPALSGGFLATAKRLQSSVYAEIGAPRLGEGE